MKILPALCPFLLVIGCASQPAPVAVSSAVTEESRLKARYPDLPLDAARVAEKLAACTHFAGEFGGDKSVRDFEVTAAIVQLGCETIDDDVSRIVIKYAGNKAVLKALRSATEQ